MLTHPKGEIMGKENPDLKALCRTVKRTLLRIPGVKNAEASLVIEVVTYTRGGRGKDKVMSEVYKMEKTIRNSFPKIRFDFNCE